MVKYSNKDVKLSVNSSEIYCENASLSYSNALDPQLDVKSKNSSINISTGPLQGDFSLSYYLTGPDPILDIVNEKKAYTINFGGLYSSDCYLTSYSLNSTPFGSLKASASFNFFGALKGSFTPDFSKLPNDVEILNASNIDIVGGTIVKEDVLAEISYDYEVPIEPRWVLDDTAGATLKGVTSSTQRQKLNISIYDLDMSLLEKGLKEKYTINLNNKNGVTQQSFNIDSVIISKNLDANASSEGSLLVSLEMGQANISHPIGEEPVITDLSPLQGDVGSVVRIDGNNFVNVEKVLLGEFPCKISGDYSSASLSFYVSNDIYSGYNAPVHLITRGTEVTSADQFLTTNGLTF